MHNTSYRGGGYGGGYGDDRGGRSGGGGRHGGSYGGGQYGGGQRRERRGVPLSSLDPALTEVSRKVIGCAIDVHRTLGPGYAREVYLEALRADLAEQGVPVKFDQSFDVKYKDRAVGKATADLFVDGKFIVSLLNRPGEVMGYDRAVVRAQLKAADLVLGLIINFGERRLKDGLVRVLNVEKLDLGHDEEGEYEDHDDAGEEPEGAGGGEPRVVSF